MQLTICKIIVAEGNELELATYTMLLLDMIRRMQERENRKEAEVKANEIAEALSMSFAEIMKQEMKADETGHPGKHGVGDREGRRVSEPDRDADGKGRLEQKPGGSVEDKEPGKSE